MPAPATAGLVPIMTTNQFFIVAEDAGLRLDRWLSDRLPERARNQIQHDLEAGCVLVNGALQLARYKVRAGDRIEYSIPTPDTERLRPESIPLAIVHEDEQVIVINKPAGLVVHPAPGHPGGTLANALLAHCGPGLAGVGGEGRWGIVHRLDGLTSGLLVAAKTQQAYLALIDAMAERRIGRRYLGIVSGQMGENDGTIDRPLIRRATDRKKIGIARPGQGREARTDWRLLLQSGGLALLGLTLHTGRTHQIRVHLQSIGRPILGDPEYGWTRQRVAQALNTAVKNGLGPVWPERQMLHAARLSFEHPLTGEPLTFFSSPPPDMAAVLDVAWPERWPAALESWLTAPAEEE